MPNSWQPHVTHVSMPGSSDLHYLLELLKLMCIESVMSSNHLIFCWIWLYINIISLELSRDVILVRYSQKSGVIQPLGFGYLPLFSGLIFLRFLWCLRNWIGQNVRSGVSVISYGKTRVKLLANSILRKSFKGKEKIKSSWWNSSDSITAFSEM